MYKDKESDLNVSSSCSDASRFFLSVNSFSGFIYSLTAFVIFCTSEINVTFAFRKEPRVSFQLEQKKPKQQINYAAFIVVVVLCVCFGKLGIGNENNKYG